MGHIYPFNILLCQLLEIAIICPMQKARMHQVARHFNTEADIFDARINKLVPHYQEMLAALVNSLPFSNHNKIKVLDLGCGTGTVSCLVKSKFPNAFVHCVDLAPKMLEIAVRKLQRFSNIEFEQADLQHYVIEGRYDAVVSSLALHHLETDAAKAGLHRKIYRALRSGGVFAHADITVSPLKNLQQYYLSKWAEFIGKSYSKADIEKNYQRYKREDRPSVLMPEIRQLKKIGFTQVEVLWKYYNFVTYAAYK